MGRFWTSYGGEGDNADIPDYLAPHRGDELWDDYETYEKHSAIYRIKNVTMSTQVIHSV